MSISLAYFIIMMTPLKSHIQLISQVGDDIVKGTSQWKGIRVTVKLTIQMLS